MENKIISIDITSDTQGEIKENAGVMWEHNATTLKLNIAPECVGDYKHYIEYSSITGKKVRTEYLTLDTETNTILYDIPVVMTSQGSVECYFNIITVDEDGNTVQVVKPRKFCLSFDYSPDTDNSIAEAHNFSINTLLEAIEKGTFKGDKGEPFVYDDFTPEQLANIVEAVRKGMNSPSAKISYVSLPYSAWIGDASPYSQVVAVEGVTERSQVDLTPSAEQLAVFNEKDLTFVTENEGGIVTVYAFGQKPQNDYTIQVTITETERVSADV